MSYAISDLIGMVRNQIRDNCSPQAFPDSAPHAPPLNDSPELTQFVTASLADFSRYRALRKPCTLNVTAGTATYTLPGDWLSVDPESFERVAHPRRDRERWDGIGEWPEWYFEPVQISGVLSPQPCAHFEFYDEAQQVVIKPTPLASYTLTFDYNALHTAATLPAQWAEPALMPAYERALRALATDQAVKLRYYKIANGISVDNREIAKDLLKQAEDWHERFRREVVLRPFGMMGGR